MAYEQVRTWSVLAVVLLSGCAPEAAWSPIHGAYNPVKTATLTTDSFQIPDPAGVVDVLMVVDNSASMVEEQQLLSGLATSFAAELLAGPHDFHAGVVTTDMDDEAQSGRLRDVDGLRWIDRDTADIESVFESMMVAGTEGSWSENGKEAAFTALEIERDAYNAGFLRENSEVHIVVISDANDDTVTPTRDEFLDWVHGLRAFDSQVSFNSIVSPSPVCPDAVASGLDYLEMSSAVGGLLWSVCTDEWMPLMISLEASLHEFGTFNLSDPAVSETILVQVERDGITFEPDAWLFQPRLNAVVFDSDFEFEAGDVLQVSYESAR